VIADDHGYLWFGTTRTISRVSQRDLEEVDQGKRQRVAVTTFDTTDTRRETAARRSRTPGVWKSRDGRLWFATLRGVITVEPKRVRVNKLPPQVLIEQALVDGRPALPGQANEFPPDRATSSCTTPASPCWSRARSSSATSWRASTPTGSTPAPARRLLHQCPRGRLPLPGAGQQRRRRLERGRSNAGSAALAALLPDTLVLWAGGAHRLCAGVRAVPARLHSLRGQYLAVFAERSRLARELHDSLLQGMSAVSLELENIRAKLPPGAADAARRLETVENALTASLEETRRFVWNLREQKPTTGDLALALSLMAGRLSDGRDVACKVDVTGEPVHLSHEAQGTLFKVAQEAVTNALKHAGARRIDLQLRYAGDGVELWCGTTAVASARARLRARASSTSASGDAGARPQAGRQLIIDSRPTEGTQVRLALPLATRRTVDV
jgi:signal transduction histidine kinase